MSTLIITKSNNATKVWFDDTKFYILLEDARELAVPLDWFPKLRDATKVQLNNWRLIGEGEGIHWQDLDEDISVEMLLV